MYSTKYSSHSFPCYLWQEMCKQSKGIDGSENQRIGRDTK